MSDLTDLCQTCTHPRSAHIYEEGACRPGFVCPAGCQQFVPYPHVLRTEEERAARDRILAYPPLTLLRCGWEIEPGRVQGSTYYRTGEGLGPTDRDHRPDDVLRSAIQRIHLPNPDQKWGIQVLALPHDLIRTLLQTTMVDPTQCAYCEGTGWVFLDKSYDGYPYGRGPYVEPDDLNGGYEPCGRCNSDREVEFGSGEKVKPWRRWDDEDVDEIVAALAASPLSGDSGG